MLKFIISFVLVIAFIVVFGNKTISAMEVVQGTTPPKLKNVSYFEMGINGLLPEGTVGYWKEF